MARRLAVAFEVELLVAQGSAQLLVRGLGVVVGESFFQQFVNLGQRPPSDLLRGLWFAEGLANHFHQVVQLLIGFVFLDQRGDFLVVQPVVFAFVKQMEHLRKELFVVDVILEIDVLSRGDAYADETARACGIDQRLLLVGSADE